MLGEMVRELRFRAGITQEELAEVIGVSKMTISRWERGDSIPTRRLAKIANALNSTVDEIERLAAEAAAPKSPPELTTQPAHVHSQDSLVTWMRAVGRAQHADPMLKLLLLSLPILLDEGAWIVPVTVDQLIGVTHMHEAAAKIREVWPQVVGSPWVERMGQVEWVFRLRFDKGE